METMQLTIRKVIRLFRHLWRKQEKTV